MFNIGKRARIIKNLSKHEKEFPIGSEVDILRLIWNNQGKIYYIVRQRYGDNLQWYMQDTELEFL